MSGATTLMASICSSITRFLYSSIVSFAPAETRERNIATVHLGINLDFDFFAGKAFEKRNIQFEGLGQIGINHLRIIICLASIFLLAALDVLVYLGLEVLQGGDKRHILGLVLEERAVHLEELTEFDGFPTLFCIDAELPHFLRCFQLSGYVVGIVVIFFVHEGDAHVVPADGDVGFLLVYKLHLLFQPAERGVYRSVDFHVNGFTVGELFGGFSFAEDDFDGCAVIILRHYHVQFVFTHCLFLFYG